MGRIKNTTYFLGEPKNDKRNFITHTYPITNNMGLLGTGNRKQKWEVIYEKLQRKRWGGGHNANP